MGNLSRQHIYDAGRRDPKQPRTVNYNGERRAERYPSGVTERFIDLQGNVVTVQIVPPGTPATEDAVTKGRGAVLRSRNADNSVQAFVSHGKCPIRHGTTVASEALRDEFARMPTNLHTRCEHDPDVVAVKGQGRNRSVEYRNGCPHIEWLIADRRSRESARRAQRHSQTTTVLDLEKQKVALQEAALAEQRLANERLASAVENALTTPPKSPRKGAPE